MYQDDEFGLEVKRRRRTRWPEGHEHEAGRRDHLQARRHRLLFADAEAAVQPSATSWCWAPSSAKRSAPWPRHSAWASSPPSWAPARAYTDLIHKLGGPAMDGFYATMTVQHPLPGRGGPAHPLLGQQVQDQVQRRPDGVLGVRLQRGGRLPARGGQGRGLASPPTASSRPWTAPPIPPDIFGAAEMTFSPTKRLGQQRHPGCRSCRAAAGRWCPST